MTICMPYMQAAFKEGTVARDPQTPAWLECRKGNCGDCGWENQYPACPTLLASSEQMTFRVLSSAVEYVSWMAKKVGPPPARKKKLKVDQKVQVTAPAHVFLEYMSERMKAWIPHWVVENHQQLTRTRCIAEVGKAPPGERLEVLVDWSEKLMLEPNESATGATYEKIGLVVAVCVYRSKEGVESETMAGICESATNDVPHTHVFLRKVLKEFADRSQLQGTTLKHVNIWSDGGPAHFKCAEGFAFSSHLLSELRQVSTNPAAVLVWNFMQSYHGKGPYDAEVLVLAQRNVTTC